MLKVAVALMEQRCNWQIFRVQYLSYWTIGVGSKHSLSDADSFIYTRTSTLFPNI